MTLPSESDAKRWNARYRAQDIHDNADPDEILTEWLTGAGNGRRALDVACGSGANTLHLARNGYQVVAADISIAGLRLLKRRVANYLHRVDVLAVDLDSFIPATAQFDLIVMIRYLNRSLIPRLCNSLKPGGEIFLRTFNQNMLSAKPGFNPDFVLETGELRQTFSAFESLATNDSPENQQLQTFWYGRKPR